MQISGVRFLRRGNLIAPGAGAVIGVADLDPAILLDADRLGRWLTCVPTSLRLSRADLHGPQKDVLPRLLLALTEQARLDPAPARLLQASTTSLHLWLPVDDLGAAQAAAALTVHILDAVAQDRPADATTARLWAALRSRFWNQTHLHLARAARQLDIPFYRVHRDGQEFLQLGQGCRLRLGRETLTDRTPLLAHFATDKEALHSLLEHRGVPLPAQQAVESLEQALAAAERIGWPVVLKPASGGKGRGVWVGLSGPEALRKAWTQAPDQGGNGRQLVQQTLSGADHRLLVIDGQLVAVAQRQPAVLSSDGLRPLRQQIAELNAQPERGVAYERLLNRVPVDERLALLLSEQGFSLDSIPPAGVRLQLSRAANISQGGTAIDCSDRVHPDNRRLAEDIARLTGADVLGLDLISRDLAVSWREGGTWLLEVNLSPGLRPHLVAHPGSDLCRRIVRQRLGGGSHQGRIPTALITGSIGKTTTSRILAHLLLGTGLRVGLSSSTGVELDGQRIRAGDLAGGGPALQLLQDPRVEALVAEIARGSILKFGLGIEQATVGAVLNVLDNHIGMEGIGSRQDLARIKAVVAEAVQQMLVLNADDPLVLAMAQGRDAASVALVSEQPGSPAWQDHRRAGHPAVLHGGGREGQITLHVQDRPVLAIRLDEIPASENGALTSIGPAAAFAAAMAYGLGLNRDQILAGLRSFGLQPGHRRGRFEVLMEEPWRLVLAHADGPEAMASLSTYAQAVTEAEPRRRLLVCSAPDTRPDAFLQQVGRATWGFDRVICAAWDRRRGRSAEEVPALLAEGVRSLGPGGPSALVGGTESEVVTLLAREIRPGDLCVFCSFASDVMRQKLLASLG